MGEALPAVNLGANFFPVEISLGVEFTCVLSKDGRVKCFGFNDQGQLGIGTTESRGVKLEQMGENLTAVELGTDRVAIAIECGVAHTCVLLDNSNVRCFGGNMFGQLGLSDTLNYGDAPNQLGNFLPFVDLGWQVEVKRVFVGGFSSCAEISVFGPENRLKCW
jgi:alpha-tubulin suppressor-like RCC1 family protein